MYDPVKPDLPPTAYHPYPSQYIVPMHYKNPITGKQNPTPGPTI